MSADPSTVPPSATAGAVTARRRWPVDGLAAGVAAAVALLVAAARPLVDIDVFWHVLVGQDILAGVPVREAGRGWSVAPVPDTWVSTQWLAEVLFARLHEWDGWTGLLWFRYLSVALVLVVLALTTFAGRTVRAGAVPFVLGAAVLAGFSQERSAQFTYLLAPVVGALVWRALVRGSLPPWWAVLAVAVLWANVHGGWVLAVLGCVLVVLGRWVDHGVRDRTAARALLLVPVAVLGAVLCPLGVANLLSPLRFAQAASVGIVEWQRVVPWQVPEGGLLWVAMVLPWVLSWWRGSPRPPRSQVVVVLALVGFSLLAWRNVPVVVLMLAPMLADRLLTSWPAAGPSVGGAVRWPAMTMPDRLGVVVALVALLGGALLVGRFGEIPDDQPAALAVRLTTMASPQRVLNDYNTAGVLLFCAGPDRVKVAVDGRTERHGADYLRRYDDLANARPGWGSLVDEIAPTSAVLRAGSPLAQALTMQRGWREIARTPAGYVLLVPGNADVVPVQPAARTDASCTAAAAVTSSAR